MKRWWKMVICHHEHSYLDWRAILCRRRTNYVYAIFFFNIFEFGLLDFRLWTQSNFSSAWYDNQFSLFFLFFFVFFFFLPCSDDLSTSGNDAHHKWPFRLKHYFTCENCFERVDFWSRVVHIISVPKKWLWLKSVPKNWAIFFFINVP